MTVWEVATLSSSRIRGNRQWSVLLSIVCEKDFMTERFVQLLCENMPYLLRRGRPAKRRLKILVEKGTSSWKIVF
jgi:hypothetical protein